MTIMFECDGNVNWKPFYFRSRLMRRVGWLWFAVAITPYDLKSYNERVKEAIWVEKSTYPWA